MSVSGQGFVVCDRVIWRNARGRLCHGIVQLVMNEALIVEESFSLEPRKSASVFDDAFFQAKIGWEIIAFADVLRKQNL